MNIFNKQNLKETMKSVFKRHYELCEADADGYHTNELEDEREFLSSIIHTFYDIHGKHADEYFDFDFKGKTHV